MGLPIMHQRCAHGTAFDRAGKEPPEGGGMIAAILAAAELAKREFRFVS